MIQQVLRKQRVSVQYTNMTPLLAFAAAIDEKTKAIYVESITNPKYTVSDIPALSKVS